MEDSIAVPLFAYYYRYLSLDNGEILKQYFEGEFVGKLMQLSGTVDEIQDKTIIATPNFYDPIQLIHPKKLIKIKIPDEYSSLSSIFFEPREEFNVIARIDKYRDEILSVTFVDQSNETAQLVDPTISFTQIWSLFRQPLLLDPLPFCQFPTPIVGSFTSLNIPTTESLSQTQSQPIPLKCYFQPKSKYVNKSDSYGMKIPHPDNELSQLLCSNPTKVPSNMSEHIVSLTHFHSSNRSRSSSSRSSAQEFNAYYFEHQKTVTLLNKKAYSGVDSLFSSLLECEPNYHEENTTYKKLPSSSSSSAGTQLTSIGPTIQDEDILAEELKCLQALSTDPRCNKEDHLSFLTSVKRPGDLSAQYKEFQNNRTELLLQIQKHKEDNTLYEQYTKLLNEFTTLYTKTKETIGERLKQIYDEQIDKLQQFHARLQVLSPSLRAVNSSNPNEDPEEALLSLWAQEDDICTDTFNLSELKIEPFTDGGHILDEVSLKAFVVPLLPSEWEMLITALDQFHTEYTYIILYQTSELMDIKELQNSGLEAKLKELKQIANEIIKIGGKVSEHYPSLHDFHLPVPDNLKHLLKADETGNTGTSEPAQPSSSSPAGTKADDELLPTELSHTFILHSPRYFYDINMVQQIPEPKKDTNNNTAS